MTAESQSEVMPMEAKSVGAISMERRSFLRTGVGATAALAVGTLGSRRALAQSGSDGMRWRAFEVVTRAEIVSPTGPVRVWLPLPLTADTDYFKNLGQSWTGNAKAGRVIREDKYGTSIFFAEDDGARARRLGAAAPGSRRGPSA
jgi:hypothetical protein